MTKRKIFNDVQYILLNIFNFLLYILMIIKKIFVNFATSDYPLKVVEHCHPVPLVA